MQDELLQRHRHSRAEAANTGEVRPRAGEHLEYPSPDPRGPVPRDSVRASEIRADANYAGVRVTLLVI